LHCLIFIYFHSYPWTHFRAHSLIALYVFISYSSSLRYILVVTFIPRRFTRLPQSFGFPKTEVRHLSSLCYFVYLLTSYLVFVPRYMISIYLVVWLPKDWASYLDSYRLWAPPPVLKTSN
jgi:hypothetical protein